MTFDNFERTQNFKFSSFVHYLLGQVRYSIQISQRFHLHAYSTYDTFKSSGYSTTIMWPTPTKLAISVEKYVFFSNLLILKVLKLYVVKWQHGLSHLLKSFTYVKSIFLLEIPLLLIYHMFIGLYLKKWGGDLWQVLWQCVT